MKFSDLTRARQQLNSFVKEAGILGLAGKALTAPVKTVGHSLWNASKKQGGPFAPLLFGGAVLGGGAIAKKSVGQAKNYGVGFNPQFQEAMVRS